MADIFLKSLDGQYIISLDAVTSTDKSRQNSVTQSSVMSGAKASDGYTIGNYTVNLSGLITYNKIGTLDGTDTPDPLEFQKQLEELENNFTRFTLYGNSLISRLDNCVISGSTVTVDRYSDTINVSLSITQVFVSQQATETIIINPTKSSEQEVSSKEDKGDGSKSEDTEEKSVGVLKSLTTAGYDAVVQRYAGNISGEGGS